MIIDASVGIKWLVPEEHSDAALALIGSNDLIVPWLFYSEVLNGLWKKHRRGEIDVRKILAHIPDLPNLVRTVDEIPFAERAMGIAVELAHPAYDCVYLAMAEAKDELLLTADERLLGVVRETAYKNRVRSLVE